MPIFPMSELMAQDGENVFLLQMQECVEKHDTLILPKAKEVGVAMAGALGAVYLEKLRKRELHLGGQVLYLFLQVFVLQRFDLVEYWLNEVWINPHEGENQRLGKAPEIQVEEIATPMHDPNQQGNQQPAKKVGQQF